MDDICHIHVYLEASNSRFIFLDRSHQAFELGQQVVVDFGGRRRARHSPWLVCWDRTGDVSRSRLIGKGLRVTIESVKFLAD